MTSRQTAHATCLHASTATDRKRCNRARAKESLVIAVTPPAIVAFDSIRETIVDIKRSAAVQCKMEHSAIVVNSNIWARAMELSDGNKKKIEVLSATRVKVSS